MQSTHLLLFLSTKFSIIFQLTSTCDGSNEDYQTSKRKQSREQAKLAVDIANSRGSASTNRKSQIKNAYHREPKFAFNLKRLGSHHGKSAIEIDTKSLDLGKIQIEKK
jgi:hypothetical protein